MDEPADTNVAIWKSEESVRAWLDDVESRQRARVAQWRLMGLLLPFADDDAFTFVDLGAGTGAAARAVLDLYPRARAILADFSPQMMEQAAPVLRPYAGRYEYVEFDMRMGEWPAEIPATVDAIISSQCIHHLPAERKKSLFREILERLAPAGWYLNFDPVAADDPAVEAVWQRVNDRLDPDAARKRHHPTPEEAARHENHVQHMQPLEPQLRYLREAGFDAVDVYWRQLDYVIYAGMRPAGMGSRTPGTHPE